MAESKSCPYCGEPQTAPAGPEGTLFRCRNCGLIGRMRAREGILRYYEERYFEDHAQDQLSGERSGIYEHILNRLEPAGSGSLLDVGCGCGFFLKAAAKRGWRVTGIDPSEQSVRFARDLLGDAVHEKTLNAFAVQEPYDVITLINVLDHSLHPWKDLHRIMDLLKPGGIVFIRIPNGRLHFLLLQWLQWIGGKPLASRLLVFHEYSMAPGFVRRLLAETGFKNITMSNAALTGPENPRGRLSISVLKKAVSVMAALIALLSGSRILMGPSIEITARKEPV